MNTRTLLNRVTKAEQAAKTLSKFSPDCICFPEVEPPFFCDPCEEEIAAGVKCPTHGGRFKQPIFHIYVAKWRRESEPARRERCSAQYRKAWYATFSSDQGRP
jgi:hypothetical protein